MSYGQKHHSDTLFALILYMEEWTTSNGSLHVSPLHCDMFLKRMGCSWFMDSFYVGVEDGPGSVLRSRFITEEGHMVVLGKMIICFYNPMTAKGD